MAPITVMESVNYGIIRSTIWTLCVLGLTKEEKLLFGDYYSMSKFEIKYPEFVIFTYTFHASKNRFQRCLINLQVSFPFRISLQFNWLFVYEEPIIVYFSF